MIYDLTQLLKHVKGLYG